MQASRTRLTLTAAIAPLTWGSTYAVTTRWLPSGLPLFTAGAVQPLIVAGLAAPLLGKRPGRLTLLAGAVPGQLAPNSVARRTLTPTRPRPAAECVP